MDSTSEMVMPLRLRSDSSATAIQGVFMSFTVLSFAVLLLRVWTRVRLVHSFRVDDVLICIGWLLALWVCIAVFFSSSQAGLGKHIWYLEQDDVNTFNAMNLHTNWVFDWALAVVRISLLFFYVRLWPSKTFRRVCYSQVGLNVCWALIVMIVNVNTCSPVRKFWQPELSGKCRNPIPFWLVTAILDVVLDVSVYVLPLPMIRRMGFGSRQRMSLYAIFGLGFFACVAGLIRVPSLIRLQGPEGEDFSFEVWITLVWSAIELNLGLATACIPCLKVLFHRILFPDVPLASDQSSPLKKIGRFVKHAHHSDSPGGHAHIKDKTVEDGLWSTAINEPIIATPLAAKALPSRPPRKNLAVPLSNLSGRLLTQKNTLALPSTPRTNISPARPAPTEAIPPVPLVPVKPTTVFITRSQSKLTAPPPAVSIASHEADLEKAIKSSSHTPTANNPNLLSLRTLQTHLTVPRSGSALSNTSNASSTITNLSSFLANIPYKLANLKHLRPDNRNHNGGSGGADDGTGLVGGGSRNGSGDNRGHPMSSNMDMNNDYDNYNYDYSDERTVSYIRGSLAPSSPTLSPRFTIRTAERRRASSIVARTDIDVRIDAVGSSVGGGKENVRDGKRDKEDWGLSRETEKGKEKKKKSWRMSDIKRGARTRGESDEREGVAGRSSTMLRMEVWNENVLASTGEAVDSKKDRNEKEGEADEGKREKKEDGHQVEKQYIKDREEARKNKRRRRETEVWV